MPERTKQATSPTPPPTPEWFALPDPEHGRDGTGLRFGCTMCGNCCSGPEGYVLVNDEEIKALARRLGMSERAFIDEHTRMTGEGRSLREKQSENGLDCEFLDRQKILAARRQVYRIGLAVPHVAVLNSVIKSRQDVEGPERTCPGIDQGHTSWCRFGSQVMAEI